MLHRKRRCLGHACLAELFRDERDRTEKNVKSDDPRLEKAREQLLERIKKYDEMMLTVFKNHLGCEQFSTNFCQRRHSVGRGENARAKST